MFTITTTHKSNASGGSQVIAKANGRQRTINVDLSKSVEVNHAAAAGALLNVLATDEQQTKVRHPSGAQRVRVEPISLMGGKMVWHIDV